MRRPFPLWKDRLRPGLQLILVLALASLTGCIPPKTRRAERYAGPTDPMPRVVADINSNASRIPTLWARIYFAGSLVDPRGKITHVNSEGLLLMSRPRSLRMVARKPGATLFDMGTDGTRFWMSVPIEVDTMWWGHNKNLGKPCLRADARIPIQPDAVFEVLGVGGFDVSNVNQPPVPVMRFDSDRDAYVFLWSRPLANHWAPTREVWFDRATKHPFLVLIYDDNGRVVLRAELADHKPIDADAPTTDGTPPPSIARVYRLSFPDSGSKITLSLDEVRLRSDEGAPVDRSFAMPDPERAGVSKVEQIDANCRD